MTSIRYDARRGAVLLPHEAPSSPGALRVFDEAEAVTALRQVGYVVERGSAQRVTAHARLPDLSRMDADTQRDVIVGAIRYARRVALVDLAEHVPYRVAAVSGCPMVIASIAAVIEDPTAWSAEQMQGWVG